MGPGAAALPLTPRGLYSAAHACVNEASAGLVAPYAAAPARPRRPAMLLMLMMLPTPRAAMPGANAETRKNGALTLAANIASKDPILNVSVDPHTENPALLTRMSMSPTSLAKRAMLAASARSAATKRARPPCYLI